MSATSEQLSGLLNIDKPRGITSHDVVARVRRLARQRRVGHAGTLDPLATGVLLVCLGQATRVSEYLMAGLKQYRATIRFGLTTDTLDADGQVLARSDPSGLTEPQLKAALPAFVGEIEQSPPIFSALKVAGQPLYKRARAGERPEVEPRRITIHSLSWVAWQPPELTLEITCSPGTYIRSLARDLGEALGTGAHLAGLIRTASGGWSLSAAVPLAQLEEEVAADPAAWQRYLHPLDQALSHFPRVSLDEAAATRVIQGQQIPLEVDLSGALLVSPGEELVRAYTPTGSFLAILTRVAPGDKLWQPKKVFQTIC